MELHGAQRNKNIWRHLTARKTSTDLHVFCLLKELFLYNCAESSVLGTRRNKNIKGIVHPLLQIDVLADCECIHTNAAPG